MPLICVLFFAFMYQFVFGNSFSIQGHSASLYKLLEMNVVAKIFLLLIAYSTAYTVNH